MQCITVVIADRHPVVLHGLISLLRADGDFNIVARCSDGESCLEALRKFAPDIALVAPSMAGVTAREILAIAKSENLASRFVFFTTSHEDSELIMSAAADGYSIISKDASPEVLLESLRQVAKSQTALRPPSREQAASRVQGAITQNTLTMLTDREHQIMRLVSEGLSNKEIGRRLNISDGTIKVHLHHIFQKLEINNRTLLAALAISSDDRVIDQK